MFFDIFICILGTVVFSSISWFKINPY